MNLYLDDDSAKRVLVALLNKAGHRVVVPASVAMRGKSDPRQFIFASQQGLVLLTRNHDHFEDLHLLVQATAGQHGGILVVRSDNDPSRDMKDRNIIRAIGKLEMPGVPLLNKLHVLNHWR